MAPAVSAARAAWAFRSWTRAVVHGGRQGGLVDVALGGVDAHLVALDLALVDLDLLRRGARGQRGEGRLGVPQLDPRGVQLTGGLVVALLGL